MPSILPSNGQLPQKSKALVVEEQGGQFKLVDIDVNPEALSDDDILINFHSTGICQTDIGSWSGKIPSKFPCILGHEGAGEVLKVGANFQSKFKKGDFIVASFISCGDCNACKRKETANCDLFLVVNVAWHDKHFKTTKIDYSSSGSEDNNKKQAYVKYFGQSSFGNIMAVNGLGVNLVSNDVPTTFTCALACGFQTGFSAVMERAHGKMTQTNRIYDRFKTIDPSLTIDEDDIVAPSSQQQESFENETLLVTGLGAVGIGALAAGKLLKFGKIIACDVNENRLELVKSKLNIEDCIDAKQLSETEAFVQHIKEKSIQKRGSTLFIEASGNPKALANGILSMAIAGKAIILGVLPPESVLDIPAPKILENNWTLEGILMGNSNPTITLPFLVRLLKQGHLNIVEFMIKTYKPDEINQAIQDAKSGEVIKPVIEWI